MNQTLEWIAGKRMSRIRTSKTCSLPYWTKTKTRNCPYKNSTCSTHGRKYLAILEISITSFGLVENPQLLNPVGTRLIDNFGILLSKINSAKEVQTHFQLKKKPLFYLFKVGNISKKGGVEWQFLFYKNMFTLKLLTYLYNIKTNAKRMYTHVSNL